MARLPPATQALEETHRLSSTPLQTPVRPSASRRTQHAGLLLAPCPALERVRALEGSWATSRKLGHHFQLQRTATHTTRGKVDLHADRRSEATIEGEVPSAHLPGEPRGAAGRERELGLDLREREELLMLAEREARAGGRRATASALAQEAALAFLVPCCTRGLLSYCQLLWCQRVSKQWNADVLVALRHLSRLSFRASYVDGALPPPPADAPGAYHVLHHRASRRTLPHGQASQEVTLEQYAAEVTDVVTALERVGPSNLVHLDLSHAADLHRDLPEAEGRTESDTGRAYYASMLTRVPYLIRMRYGTRVSMDASAP